MPIAFPVALADFFNKLQIVECSFELGENVTVMNTGGGETLASAYGTRVWRGRVRTRILRHSDAESIMSRIRMITNARATFFVKPLHRVIAGTLGNPTISAVQAGYEIRFQALPANFTIPQGTYFSYSYDSGRRAFHQTVEAVTADGLGVTPFVQVEPEIRPGWAAGAAVDFASPMARAVYVPNSLDNPVIRSVLMDGPSFEWRQTLRQ